jgi:plastocyanin
MTLRRARVFAAVALAWAAVAACGSDPSGPLITDAPSAGEADYTYVIPEGTADRLEAGELVEIIPAQLDVKVGEVIRVVNEDDEGHFVGIFYVGAGETVTQRFASPGEYVGQCSVHPSGQLTLTISE